MLIYRGCHSRGCGGDLKKNLKKFKKSLDKPEKADFAAVFLILMNKAVNPLKQKEFALNNNS